MGFHDIEQAVEHVPAALGYLAVETARGERRFVLGPRTQLEGDLPALDWRTAPLAEAFFRHAPGGGDTRVAPPRVPPLGRRARRDGRRFRALVLVPTEGLRRLVRLLADRLGIGKLEIAVIDDWLIERARTAFPGLPRRASEGA